MPAIIVSFAPLPAHVRTARLVALATARRAGVAEDLLDEVRFAVGEACSRAVGINADSGEPVVLTLLDDVEKFTVEVRDVGSSQDGEADLLASLDTAALAWPEPGAAEPGAAGTGEAGADEAGAGATRDSGGRLPDPLPPGFGLAVISGLVEDAAVTQASDGTRVTLSWPATSPEPPGAT